MKYEVFTCKFYLCVSFHYHLTVDLQYHLSIIADNMLQPQSETIVYLLRFKFLSQTAVKVNLTISS